MTSTLRCRRPAVLGALFLTISLATCMQMKAQTTTAPPDARAEIALTYEHLNSNTLPTGCGCFGLNGGGIDFAWRPRKSHFAGVFNASIDHAGSITTSNYNLTLSTFMIGVRYLPYRSQRRLQPYVQVSAGGAHSVGTLVQGNAVPASGSGGAFAGSAGSGLDLRLGRRFSIRLVEADYLVTTFANGSNNHQNNLRLDAGVVVHF